MEVDNTDTEGRYVLGDALAYADTFSPHVLIDLATLTGAACIALGTSASAIYTKSSKFGEAGSCTAAAFLSEFTQTKEWVHIDIASV
ncbi:hypothetical protein MXB_419, partial [Myxobolus squamalis]